MPAPVVLVHGFATDCARTWGDNGWLDLLADSGRSTVPIDLLGHGTAERPHDPAAYADLEDWTAARLPDGPVDAVGFSMGARVLLTIVCRTPERFGRLALLGIGAGVLEHRDAGVIADAVEGRADPADPMAQYFAGLAAHPGSDPQALSAFIRAPRPDLTPDVLAGATLPVLVVLGDRDFTWPPEPLVDALPDARLVVLRGVDHFATPKDFGAIDAVLDFLGGDP